MSDNELPKLPGPTKLHTVLPDDYRYGHIYGFTIGQMREYGRACERAAYKRAAQECDPHDDDDSIDRQIKREIAERIRALGRQHD